VAAVPSGLSLSTVRMIIIKKTRFEAQKNYYLVEDDLLYRKVKCGG
jgi:hypothetical protein